MKLKSLKDDEHGITIVICAGHVDPLQFANRVDTDDVVELLGDDCKIKDSYPTDASVRRLAKEVRHSWGVWRGRVWEETRKDAIGASPFTVVGQP